MEYLYSQKLYYMKLEHGQYDAKNNFECNGKQWNFENNGMLGQLNCIFNV